MFGFSISDVGPRHSIVDAHALQDELTDQQPSANTSLHAGFNPASSPMQFVLPCILSIIAAGSTCESLVSCESVCQDTSLRFWDT